MDRWTNIVWRDSSSNVVAGFAYGYDSAGMITQEVLTVNNALRTYNYSYDSLDRLIAVTSASFATSVVTYAYDLAGNRTQMVDNAATSAYAFGSGDRLVSWGTNAENTVQYDVAGNVTNMGFGAGRTVSLTWNARYQLTAAATNGATVERYGYDVLGRRAWTADGSMTNWHVYDGPHVVADLDATGGVLRAYSYGPGIDNILSMTVRTNDGGTTSVSSVFYYVKDHLGSVHALVDAAGSVVERYEYDAWGRVLGVFDGAGNALAATAIGNRYLWQGREYSWATGLYCFRARWYEPVIGRWLSNDPIGISGGLNQYVFCANNPVNFVDPFGLWRSSGHVDLTIRAAASTGLSGGDVDKIIIANLNVDRLRNQGNNPAHAMPNTLPAFWNVIHEALEEAVRLEKIHRHDDAMAKLGEGLHTLQDFEPHYTQDGGWRQHILGVMTMGWLSPDNPDRHRWEYASSLAESHAYLQQFVERTKKGCD
jgi:RHS repeat-associated protein